MKKILFKYAPAPLKNLYKKYKIKQYKDLISAMSTEEVFQYIYKKRVWGKPGNESGGGSSKETTTVIRKEIQRIIKQYNIKTLLDLPCGDFHWMQELDLSKINYTGGDIVEELINKNKELYETDSIKFEQLDIIKDKLPQSDLLLCRDCFVHLSIPQIIKSLENIRSSHIKYLLVTSFSNTTSNIDILTGEWRPLNMEIAPFNLIPIEVLNEGFALSNGDFSDKSLILVDMTKWDL